MALLLSAVLTTLAKNDETFVIRFTVYGLRPGDYEGIVCVDATGQAQEIDFKTKSRAEVYTATLLIAAPQVTFYRKDSLNKALPAPIAITSIRADTSKVLLIFSKAENNPGIDRFRVSSIPDDSTGFPLGSVRVVNLTNTPVIGSANGTHFKLEPRQCSQAVRGQSKRKASIAVVAENRSRYHLVYKKSVPLDAQSRSLLILRPPVRTGSLHVGGHLLTDSPGPEGN